MKLDIFINQDDMLIAKDEIFGPVQSILKFKWVKKIHIPNPLQFCISRKHSA